MPEMEEKPGTSISVRTDLGPLARWESALALASPPYLLPVLVS